MPLVVMDVLGHLGLMHYDYPFSWLLSKLNGIPVIMITATQKWNQNTELKASHADHIVSALFSLIIPFIVVYLKLGLVLLSFDVNNWIIGVIKRKEYLNDWML